MNENPRFEIHANLIKNRLYILLEGRFPDELITQAADRTISEAKKLKAGFATITNIAKFVAATAFGSNEIKRAQLFLKEHGVKRVIRIIDSAGNLITRLQFDRTGRQAYGQDADVAASVQEAETMLEEAGL